MKKNTYLLGASTALFFLICAVTVHASQETGKYGGAAKAGQGIEKQKTVDETSMELVNMYLGEGTENDDTNGHTGGDTKKEDVGNQTGDYTGKDQPEQEKEEGEKETLPDETEDMKPEHPVMKPAESMIMPEILYPEIDGKNGYYKSYPDIQIIHREVEAVTKYELLAADGSKKQGSLDLENDIEEAICLSGECLKEGENILRVSMERKEIKLPEKTEESDSADEKANSKEVESTEEAEKIVFTKEIRFLIDTKIPDKVRFSYGQARDKGTIFVNDTLEITLKSEDAGSGMEKICYQASDGTIGMFSEGNGKIMLNPDFHGSIEAYAVDKAGNQSESTVSETILCENRPPEILIQTQGAGELWHSGPVNVHVEVSDSGLSSGIRSLKCYSAGSVIVQEENASGTGITGMQTDFVVDLSSEDGNGIPIIVEAVDWAGNYYTENILLYIDSADPLIQSEGISDKMITGESVKGRILFREENILAYRKMEIWKIDSDKSKEQLEKKEEQELTAALSDAGWDISIEEDGVYEIYAAAKDLAGHKSEKRYQITVDKTNPVIHYVDQMQGAYVPYFQWNYGKEEVVQDQTDYSYVIRMDGAFYNAGTRVTEEGARVLQVEAVDAAGNKSTAEAVFQIDHTPPKIRIYDVQDGISYEEMAAISISVDGKGEYLKGITVNSEKKRLGTGCQIFRQTFEEPGDYRIRVLAEDLAGNQENAQVTFRIEEQKRMSGDVWKPVTKIFRNDNVSTTSQEVAGENAEESNRLAAVCLTACFGLAVLAAGIRQWWIRKK